MSSICNVLFMSVVW